MIDYILLMRILIYGNLFTDNRPVDFVHASGTHTMF